MLSPDAAPLTTLRPQELIMKKTNLPNWQKVILFGRLSVSKVVVVE
jgi:hypothetical protein